MVRKGLQGPVRNFVVSILSLFPRKCSTPQATFMINCLYRIQNVLTLFEFTDARIEQLDAQIATHVDTLIEAQAQHAARRSGLEYFIQRAAEWHREDENERPALAQVESMSPEVRLNVVFP